MKHILPLLIALLLLPLTAAIQLDAQILPANPTVEDALYCQVTATGAGTINANITWFVGGVAHTTDNESLVLTTGMATNTSETGALEPFDHSRGEVWECQVTVANGTTTNTTNTTAVAIQNAAPRITTSTNTISTLEDDPYGPLIIDAYDPDGDALTWVAVDLNESLYSDVPLFGNDDLSTVDLDSVSISFTPEVDAIGNHTMLIIAIDGNQSGGKNINFEILSVNDSPVLSPLAYQNATEGINWSYVVTASDEESDALNFSLQTNQPNLQITQLSGTTASISFAGPAPTFLDGGVFTVNVTVYENASPINNDTQNFTLNVSTVNREPTIIEYNASESTQGLSFTLNISANDSNSEDNIVFDVIGNCPLENPWSIVTIDGNSTGALGRINVTTLTNDHIVCKNITIFAIDQYLTTNKSNTSITIDLNLTNINDAPIIYEISNDVLNSQGQDNLSNLSAAANITFYYNVNGSDPDLFTNESDTLLYSTNTTLFTINSSTGVIEFTPLTQGNHLINITLEDAAGLNTSRILNLTLFPNDLPILQPIPNQSCAEDTNCSITLEAFDDDAGENLTYSITLLNQTTLSGFNSSPSPAVLWSTFNTSFAEYNYSNDEVGTYQYFVQVEDRYGGRDNATFWLTVTNANDAPIFDANQNNVSDNISDSWPPIIVENTSFVYYLNITDVDYTNTDENLTLSYNITGPNTSLLNVTNLSETHYEIRFTPSLTSNGNYTVNFTATDELGGTAFQEFTFSVYNQGLRPNITRVRPFYNSTTDQTVENESALIDSLTLPMAVTLREGLSYTFNVSFTDLDTTNDNMTVSWYIDGELQQLTAANIDYSFDVTYGYFDSGTYSYQVVVQDNRLAADTFNWTVQVNNTNRLPQFRGPLGNLSFNSTLPLTTYMSVFYDPDDDLNSDDLINGNETNSLTFTNTPTTFVDITYSGISTTLEPLATGVENVVYTATDSDGASIQSNTVSYNVTFIENEDQQTSTESSSSSGGGGGGGGSSSFPLPIPMDNEEEPFNIQLIVPRPMTAYYNQTIAAPIVVKNPTERSLRGVSLTAQGPENVSLRYDVNAIPVIEPGRNQSVILYIENYREPGTYEIEVIANVDDPEINDSAILFINSLEQTEEGDAVNTKVTFARDLVASNPECVELNELVNQAQRAVDTGQFNEANRILDAVVEGCRYLVQESTNREESPNGISLAFLSQFRYANLVLAVLLIILLAVATLLFLHYHSASKQE